MSAVFAFSLSTTPIQAQGKVLVGLSFSDFETPRWPQENVIMTDALKAMGYDVVSQQAGHDPKTQNDQIANMVTQGAKAIIIVAQDADAAATAVEDAAKEGVVVIAYDRLIATPKIAAYITFGLTQVGNGQADGVLKALGITAIDSTGKWTKDNPVNLVKLEGDPGDNNAKFFEAGQDEILKPYVDAGIVKVVARQNIANWDETNAVTAMENILTSQNNKVDAVIAANDNLGLGALQALTAQKLSVPVSGQDATAPGCNSIAKGQLTVTILKDYRVMAPQAVELVDEFLNGKTDPDLKSYKLADLTGNASLTGDVMAKYLPVTEVTKDNLYEAVVVSGFQSYDDVYQDIPEAEKPARPEATKAP
ncbi:MAG: substrate-binding domain-containing protein [Anaerolineae bacterium]|nr:substrate-binding domain-containing protein [Anaerolineae bacterium]